MHKVTAHWLSQFKVKGKQYKRNQHNLSVVVNPSGKISIAFYYKADGKQKRIPIGSYVGKPSKELIAEMNASYQSLLVDHAQGMDIVTERAEAQGFHDNRPQESDFDLFKATPLPVEYTLRHAARLYLIDFKAQGKASYMQEGSYLKKMIEGFGNAPGVGELAPDSIQPHQLQRILDEIRKQYPRTANHSKKAVSRLWAFMKRQGMVKSREVTLDLQAPEPAARDRLLTEAELRKLSRGCHRYFLALMLNPLRVAETARMSWEMIDGDDNALLVVKSEEGRQHLQPLQDSYLQCSPTYESRDGYLFPGRHGYGHIMPNSLSEIGRKWISEVGLKDATSHDLRSACYSFGEKHGVSDKILHSVLAHKKSGLTGVYGLYDQLEERREFLEEWASYILWLRGNGPKPELVSARERQQSKRKPSPKIADTF